MARSRRRCRGRRRRGKGRLKPRSKLPFHLLGLRLEHRLAEAAELAGERGFDLVIDLGPHLGSLPGVGEPGQRCRGEPADNAKRRALDLGRDLARLLSARDFDGHLEAEFHVGHFGLEHRRIMIGRGFLQIAHTLDAGRQHARVAQRLVDFGARHLHGQLTGKFHSNSVSCRYARSAVSMSLMYSSALEITSIMACGRNWASIFDSTSSLDVAPPRISAVVITCLMLQASPIIAAAAAFSPAVATITTRSAEFTSSTRFLVRPARSLSQPFMENLSPFFGAPEKAVAVRKLARCQGDWARSLTTRSLGASSAITLMARA